MLWHSKTIEQAHWLICNILGYELYIGYKSEAVRYNTVYKGNIFKKLKANRSNSFVTYQIEVFALVTEWYEAVRHNIFDH